MSWQKIMHAESGLRPRVLVVGATGLLGSAVTSYLQRSECDVIKIGFTNSGADEYCDLLDAHLIERLITKVAPDTVVNLVALTNVDYCEEVPNDAFLLNVKAVQNLTAGMRGLRKPYLIHISTDQVYDSPGPSNEDNVQIGNVYALTKYAGEIAALRVPCTVLRTNFFGKSLLPGRLSFSDWVIERIKLGALTDVFDDVIVSPLHMSTVAAMIHRVISFRGQTETLGIFNLGSCDAMSKANLAYEFASTLSLPTHNLVRTKVDAAKLKAYRPKSMEMDVSRFEGVFGVKLPKLKDEVAKIG
jgi:dTDP-4-dehydrorhamnose reductase